MATIEDPNAKYRYATERFVNDRIFNIHEQITREQNDDDAYRHNILSTKILEKVSVDYTTLSTEIEKTSDNLEKISTAVETISAKLTNDIDCISTYINYDLEHIAIENGLCAAIDDLYLSCKNFKPDYKNDKLCAEILEHIQKNFIELSDISYNETTKDLTIYKPDGKIVIPHNNTIVNTPDGSVELDAVLDEKIKNIQENVKADVLKNTYKPSDTEDWIDVTESSSANNQPKTFKIKQQIKTKFDAQNINLSIISKYVDEMQSNFDAWLHGTDDDQLAKDIVNQLDVEIYLNDKKEILAKYTSTNIRQDIYSKFKSEAAYNLLADIKQRAITELNNITNTITDESVKTTLRKNLMSTLSINIIPYVNKFIDNTLQLAANRLSDIISCIYNNINIMFATFVNNNFNKLEETTLNTITIDMLKNKSQNEIKSEIYTAIVNNNKKDIISYIQTEILSTLKTHNINNNVIFSIDTGLGLNNLDEFIGDFLKSNFNPIPTIVSFIESIFNKGKSVYDNYLNKENINQIAKTVIDTSADIWDVTSGTAKDIGNNVIMPALRNTYKFGANILNSSWDVFTSACDTAGDWLGITGEKANMEIKDCIFSRIGYNTCSCDLSALSTNIINELSSSLSNTCSCDLSALSTNIINELSVKNQSGLATLSSLDVEVNNTTYKLNLLNNKKLIFENSDTIDISANTDSSGNLVLEFHAHYTNP